MAASPHDVESDAMLVLAAQDGDPDAFSELFRRHYPAIRRVCARKLRDLREADEIAQAAFVRAYERLDKCGGERRFGAWVQVIANNLCIDHLRATARTTPVDEPLDQVVSTGASHPEDALLHAEQAAMVQRALASLPDRQRDVVVARDVEGRRPPEIAAALGLSLGAVDSLLLRARRRLAASVQSMSAESGAANFMTTAAVSAVGGGVTNAGALARVASAVSNGFAAASYHAAVAIGLVPGMPSLVQQAAPAAAAGLLSLAPAATGTIDAPVVPSVAPISAAVPSIDSAPDVATPTVPDASVTTTPTLPGVAPVHAPEADRETTPTVPPAADVERPSPLQLVGESVAGVADALLGSGAAR